jgi:hypothetical protein
MEFYAETKLIPSTELRSPHPHYYYPSGHFGRLRVPLEKCVSMGSRVGLESSKSSRNIRVNCCRGWGTAALGYKDVDKAIGITNSSGIDFEFFG